MSKMSHYKQGLLKYERKPYSDHRRHLNFRTGVSKEHGIVLYSVPMTFPQKPMVQYLIVNPCQKSVTS